MFPLLDLKVSLHLNLIPIFIIERLQSLNMLAYMIGLIRTTRLLSSLRQLYLLEELIHLHGLR